MVRVRMDLFLNTDTKKIYTEAMKTGYVNHKVMKCLIIGAAGVGKTTIKNLFLKKEPPLKRESTGVMDNPVRAVSFSRIGINKDAWFIVDNDKKLMKMIADVIKDGAVPRDDIKTDNTVNPVEYNDDTVHSEFIRTIDEAKDKHGSEFLSTSWIHVIDSGGQPEFHDLIPLFANKASLVIFVLKASEGLDHKPIVEYYDAEGCVGQRRSYLTHQQILEHCLKAFPGANDQVPNILMIGTHKDSQPQLLQIEELKRCLKHIEGKVFYFESDQPIALIDCLSQTKEREKMLNEIQKEIEKFIQKIDTKQTPLAWFGLELALKNASQSAKLKGVLTLKECKAEAMKFALFKHNSAQLEAALLHLADSNVFLYYPEVLPDIVFCDPQVLLTMVTRIVRHHYMLSTSQKLKHGVDMLRFVTNGCITLEILKSIMDCNDIVTPEMLLKLLYHLKIISVIHESENHCNLYLMPALLLNVEDPTQKLVPIEGKENLHPLCIVFNGGCAPIGLFCSLVASLLRLKEWKLCTVDNKPSCSFRNCIAFNYCTHNIVTVMDLFSHFRIYVQTNLKETADICQRIKQIVHSSIQDATIDFKDAIQCPNHQQENHVALWEATGYQCTVDSRLTGPVPTGYQVWGETESTCTASATPHVQSKYDSKPELNDIHNLEFMKLRPAALQLGLKVHDLDVIEANYPQDFCRQKSAILQKWLNQDLNATYGKLVTALLAVDETSCGHKLAMDNGFTEEEWLILQSNQRTVAHDSNSQLSPQESYSCLIL